MLGGKTLPVPGTAEKIHSRAGFVAYIGIPARIPSVPDMVLQHMELGHAALGAEVGSELLVPNVVGFSVFTFP